jgi:hypothetical protein
MIAFSCSYDDDLVHGELRYYTDKYVFHFVYADQERAAADAAGGLSMLFAGGLGLRVAIAGRRVLYPNGIQLLRFRQDCLLDIPLFKPGRLTIDPGTLLKTNYHPSILRRERLLDMVTATPDGEYPDPEQVHSMIGYRIRDSAPWPLLYDPGNGWYCLGDPQTGDDTVSVEFATNSVATLTGAALTAVWLRPRLVAGELPPHT